MSAPAAVLTRPAAQTSPQAEWCDRCGARAAMLYIRPADGLNLAFCGHHTGRYASGLIREGFAGRPIIATSTSGTVTSV